MIHGSLVRETPGIGDFTGAAGKPTPMLPHEVERIIKTANPEEEGEEQIKTAIPFKVGDRVRIKEGTFENFEGDVEGIDEANGRITVMINIFRTIKRRWNLSIGRLKQFSGSLRKELSMAKQFVGSAKFQVPGGQANTCSAGGNIVG